MNLKFYRSLVVAACVSVMSASTAMGQTGPTSVDFQTLPRQPLNNYSSANTAVPAFQQTSARIRRDSPESFHHDQQSLRSQPRGSAQPVSVDPALQRASYESRIRPPADSMNNRRYDPLPFPNETNDVPPNENQRTSNLGGVKRAFHAMRTNEDLDRRSIPSQKLALPDRTLAAQQSQDTDNSDPSLAGLGFKTEGVSRELIEKIGYNTMFVLAFGVGFIFVAKAWLKPKATHSKTETTEFEIVSTLKLPGKSNLMLVKVDSERLLVASDPTGVKSVTHLSDSFADKLESYSEISEPMAHSAPDFNTQLQTMDTQAESDVYSRDSLVSRPKSTKPVPKTSQTSTSEKATRNTEAIREQMEAALLKFGLKV